MRKDGPQLGKQMDEWHEERTKRIFFKDQYILSAKKRKEAADGETGKTITDTFNAV